MPPLESVSKQRLSDRFRIGQWVIDPVGLSVIDSDGRRSTIEPKMMQVLVSLAERAPGVVMREQLMNTVWTDVVVTDQSLTRVIYRLRTTLSDDTSDEYIETIRGVGYRLVKLPEIESSSSIAVRSTRSEALVQHVRNSPAKPVHRGLAAAVIVLSVFGLGRAAGPADDLPPNPWNDEAGVTIPAPSDSTALELHRFAGGSFVSNGPTLAELSP